MTKEENNNKCISLKNTRRFKLIDSLLEQGYTYDVYDFSMSELRLELYNKKKL